MTIIKMLDIKIQLDKWRNERHLNTEKQRKGLVGNLLEELSEFYRAKDEYEQVDALCDMIVFCINSLGEDITIFLKQFHSIKKEETLINLVNKLQKTNSKIFMFLIVKLAERQLEQLGYDTYDCLLETITEISSRTGHYDEELKKFVKESGAYSYQEAYKLAQQATNYKLLDSKDNQTESDYYIFIDSDRNEIKIKKWYKANYTKRAKNRF